MIQSLAFVLALLSLHQAWISLRAPTVVFRRRRECRRTKPVATLMVQWRHIAARVAMPLLVTGLLAIRTSELQLWQFAHDEMSNLDLRTRAGVLLALILWNWCLGTLAFALDGFVLNWTFKCHREPGMDIPASRRREILLALVLVNWGLGT